MFVKDIESSSFCSNCRLCNIHSQQVVGSKAIMFVILDALLLGIEDVMLQYDNPH